MSAADKVQTSMPEFEVLTPAQEVMVEDFLKAQMTPANRPAALNTYSDTERRNTAVKFLTARKWVMADAVKMFTSSFEFREAQGLLSKPMLPGAMIVRGYDQEAIREYFKMEPRPQNESVDRTFAKLRHYQHNCIHKWDRTGHPVVIDRPGKGNVKKIVEMYKAMTPPGGDVARLCVEHHLHQNEVAGYIVRHQNLTRGGEFGRQITTATVIMDCEGLGYGHLFGEAIEITKKAWAMDTAYYPEGLHRMFVVNCPSMIMFAYSMFKGMVDKRTQDKLTFCTPKETKEVLLKVIAPENLPEFLGGTCKCEGGCIGEDATDVATDADAANDEIITEDIHIPAGGDIVKTFDMEAGEQLVWAFESVTGNDIDFSVTFTCGAGKAVEVVPKARFSAEESAYTATQKGSIVAVFSNKFSWMKGKQLRLRVVKL